MKILPERVRILLVDDMTSMRGVIKMFLKEGDYTNIVEVSDGEKALALMQIKRFDFIICDWDMPIMTGLELLKAVRADERTQKIPFLMLTGNNSMEKVQQAIAEGVSDYMVKPFKPQTLLSKMESCLEKPVKFVKKIPSDETNPTQTTAPEDEPAKSE